MDKALDISKGCYPQHRLAEMRAGINYTDWILSYFKPWLKGVVCEVGAGNGNNVDSLLKANPERLILLEPDAPLCGVLKDKYDNTDKMLVSNSVLGEYAKGQAEWCDTFFYMNVLEHIEDDQEELRLMYSQLQPGGAALIFVPAIPFLYSYYDELVGHYRRYTKTDLSDKIQNAGFESVDVRYVDFMGIFAWLLFCKMFKIRLNSREVTLYDRIAVPFISRAENVLKPILGKNLLAIAVKN